MLSREDFGGSHEERLAIGIGRAGQSEGGDDGLARAHVAEEHVIGGFRRGHVREDVVARLHLLARELEWHGIAERFDACPVDDVRDWLLAVAPRIAVLHEHQL